MKNDKKRRNSYNRMMEVEKKAWIEKQIKIKNAERQKQFEESGVDGEDVCCCTCFHWNSDNCPGLEGGSMDRVCPYWYHPKAPVIGTAYLDQHAGNEVAKARSIT